MHILRNLGLNLRFGQIHNAVSVLNSYNGHRTLRCRASHKPIYSYVIHICTCIYGEDYVHTELSKGQYSAEAKISCSPILSVGNV